MHKPEFTATATLKEDCPCRREHREPLPYAPTGTADGGSLPQFAVAPSACRNLRPAPNPTGQGMTVDVALYQFTRTRFCTRCGKEVHPSNPGGLGTGGQQ